MSTEIQAPLNQELTGTLGQSLAESGGEVLFSSITHPKKRALLSAYGRTASVVKAAECAGCAREMHTYWMRTDPVYAEAFEIAKDQALHYLESVAIERATDGYKRPVYQRGQLVGYEPVKSDLLLMFTMKAAAPEKYRDNAAPSVTVNIGESTASRLEAARKRLYAGQVVDVVPEQPANQE